MALLLGGAGALGLGVVRWRRAAGSGSRLLTGRALVIVGLGLLLASHLERPFGHGIVGDRRMVALKGQAESRIQELTAQAEAIDQELSELRREDGRYRLIVRDDAGLMAPEEQSRPDVPMRISQVVRAVRPNDLSWLGRLGIYLSRWWEFLSSEPRSSNTEGGVLPVIIGTVTLTLLLTVIVVPLGVVAAIYLREYARQGPLVSLVRIAINNLAGVPSIVYGVFGLGFFAYTVGKYVDAGSPAPLPRPSWWLLMASVVGAGVVAVLLGGMAALRRREGLESHRRARITIAAAWLACAALALFAVWTTPYFHGWFEARTSVGTATFGTKGLLWASLTLALLTLPVVIVATEEAIAAVPPSLREGSYGCGASKWQTIRRIVLPGAMPGILTGAVLAIARGAGEVAPLMLVGVGKVTSGLPISSEFPFLHANRGFMHLGFHIYDVGFQSTDSEAARPLVWTTTLLLVTIVLILNSAAIVLRARLRSRHSAAF
ncbi:MAG: ABC transporter permease subunit [Phycisphaeraceae bacterium]|nr:ABC transporter permease subunit [Phycisphaeraceae bacterium]